MFMKLFGYISGANVGENEIKMTVPVSMKMRGNKNSFEKEMCFYLDNEHQSNPPQPTNRDVYIVNRPAMNVYTRFAFSSYSLPFLCIVTLQFDNCGFLKV